MLLINFSPQKLQHIRYDIRGSCIQGFPVNHDLYQAELAGIYGQDCFWNTQHKDIISGIKSAISWTATQHLTFQPLYVSGYQDDNLWDVLSLLVTLNVDADTAIMRASPVQSTTKLGGLWARTNRLYYILLLMWVYLSFWVFKYTLDSEQNA
eukprot:scaffold884_cov202-Amphora_coffeaeformis.AAC.3